MQAPNKTRTKAKGNVDAEVFFSSCLAFALGDISSTFFNFLAFYRILFLLRLWGCGIIMLS